MKESIEEILAGDSVVCEVCAWTIAFMVPYPVLSLSNVILYTPLTSSSVMEERSTTFAFSLLSLCMHAFWTELGQFFKISDVALLGCRYALVCLAIKTACSLSWSEKALWRSVLIKQDTDLSWRKWGNGAWACCLSLCKVVGVSAAVKFLPVQVRQ